MARSGITLAVLMMLVQGAVAHAGEDEHVARVGDLRIIHVWTRATNDLKKPADVFLEVENAKEADQLVSAAVDFATQSTIVGLAYKVSAATAEPLGPAEVPAHGRLVLEPNGIAIRLEGLKRPLKQGQEFQVRLSFAKAGSVTATGEVMAANARQHGHAGHSH